MCRWDWCEGYLATSGHKVGYENDQSEGESRVLDDDASREEPQAQTAERADVRRSQ